MELLTPFGLAGIAVVRADVEERRVLADMLRLPSGRPCRCSPTMPPMRAELVVDGQSIDDVLVLDRGERGLEIHLHGAFAVIDVLRARFALTPAMPRTPAERLLRDALSSAQLQLALEQMAADFPAWCRRVASLPASLRRIELAAAQHRSSAARAMVTPHRVVLVGRQNAGKSSLFNCLLARERAATGPQPGLTRDPVAETTALAGYPYELVDTAGLGIAALDLDAAAIARGVDQRAGATLLLVVDASVGLGAEDLQLAGRCAVIVANKCDLPPAAWAEHVPAHLMSSCTQGDPAALRAALGALLREVRRLPPAGPVGGAAALDEAQMRCLEALGAAAASA